MRPRLILVALFLAVAFAPGLVQAQTAAPHEAALPLLPLPGDDSEFGQRIRTRLQAALKDPCLVTAGVGITVRDARDGWLIYEKDGGVPMKPASNMKLVTGGAAQDLLGPERTLKTAFRAERNPDKAGHVGTLWVRGGGDPSLTIESLYMAARALAMRGVRKVDRIVVDDSFFAGPSRPPSWPERNHRAWYGAPSSALSMHFNVVAVHVRGGAKTGEPAGTWLDPFPDFFDLASTARTGTGGISARGSLIARADGSTAQRITVAGRVRARQSARVLVPIEDPAIFCGHGVKESLQRVGIIVEGDVTRGVLPAGTVLLHEHASKPMAELVKDMNKPSSNMFAETLLKVLGAELHGQPGTREKGAEVLRAWLEIMSPGGCTCHLADGSGLSPDNRLTTRSLTDLLLAQSIAGSSFPEYLVSLPVSGADGTLRRRFKSSHAARLVRAKTGRISRVAALSGFAEIGQGRQAVFSIMVNEYNCPSWKAEAALDRVVEALVADAQPAQDVRRRLNLRPLAEEPGETDDESESLPEEGETEAGGEVSDLGSLESVDGQEQEQQSSPE